MFFETLTSLGQDQKTENVCECFKMCAFVMLSLEVFALIYHAFELYGQLKKNNDIPVGT